MSSTWLDDDEWTGGPKRPADRAASPTPPSGIPAGRSGDAPTQWAAAPDGGAWHAPEAAPATPQPHTPPPPAAWGAPTGPTGSPAGPMVAPASSSAAQAAPQATEWGPSSTPWTRQPAESWPTAPSAGAPDTASGSTPPPRETDAGSSGERRRGGLRAILAAALVSALVAAAVTVPLTLSLVDRQADESAQAVTQPINLPAEDAPSDTTPLQPDAPTSAITSDTVAEVAEAVLPSVAVVTTFAGGTPQGSGSAVVFREDGYLVTNNHVIDGAGSVEVLLTDGRTFTAEVVGTASQFDLAVLHVDATDLTVPAYAEGDPRVGETAIAIGAPFGFNSTVTSGIVSALGRSLSDPASGVSLVDLVQTDAAINPGNSGGALVNAAGQVIGINTAIVGASGANDGIGFAVPTSSVVRVGEQLIEQGFFEYAQLGVAGTSGRITADIAEQRGLDTTNGALVGEIVPGSGADEAGLVAGDIIVRIDDTDVTEFADLSAAIRGMDPGSTVELEVVTADGERRTVEVELGGVRTND